MADKKQLVKLDIWSFEKKDFSGSTDLFTVPVNPESFTKNFKIDLDTTTGHGKKGAEAGFKSTAPEELKLEFVLDGTNTIEGYGGEDKAFKKKSVHEQLEAFLNCVYNMNGKIHRPRFLIIIWGTEINFQCVLSNLDINYTLFEPDGTPIRVKISATFLDYKTREERLAEERRHSPDLTHYRKTMQGDRLDLMTYSIYNDPGYLLQVGKANSFTSIRNIKSGTDVYFPPFDKNEA